MYAAHGVEPLQDATGDYFDSSRPIPLTIEEFTAWAIEKETSLNRLRSYEPTLETLASAYLLANLPSDMAYIKSTYSSMLQRKELPRFEDLIVDMKTTIRSLKDRPTTSTVAVVASSSSKSTSGKYKLKLDSKGIPLAPCKNCNKVGHWRKDCPQPSSTTASSTNVVATVLDAGTYNRVEAFDLCALVSPPIDGYLFDSGAVVSVCKDRSAFSRLYGKPAPSLQGVTGSAPCPDSGEITFQRPDGGLFTITDVRCAGREEEVPASCSLVRDALRQYT